VLEHCYRVLARKHFPNARIVADRFHVIRLINRPCCKQELDAGLSRTDYWRTTVFG
jgi:transposase